MGNLRERRPEGTRRSRSRRFYCRVRRAKPADWQQNPGMGQRRGGGPLFPWRGRLQQAGLPGGHGWTRFHGLLDPEPAGPPLAGPGDESGHSPHAAQLLLPRDQREVHPTPGSVQTSRPSSPHGPPGGGRTDPLPAQNMGSRSSTGEAGWGVSRVGRVPGSSCTRLSTPGVRAGGPWTLGGPDWGPEDWPGARGGWVELCRCQARTPPAGCPLVPGEEEQSSVGE